MLQVSRNVRFVLKSHEISTRARFGVKTSLLTKGRNMSLWKFSIQWLDAKTLPTLNSCQQKLWIENKSFYSIESFKDEFSNKKPTIESKLIALMDMWEMEEAVALLRLSVLNGNLPNTGVVLNLLQQLGNLGDFECLLSLRELLMDNKLCSNDKYFGCLQKAYFKSGRVDEAVLLLRMIYHDLRNYADVDIFFTLVGVMLLQHYPDQFGLIESFAKDCRDKEPPDILPTAGLWKCLILTENFKKADNLLCKHAEIEKCLPQMITDIVEKKNKVDVNRIAVLSNMTKKCALNDMLQRTIYTALVRELVSERRWDELDTVLEEINKKHIALLPVNVKEIIAKTENILFNEDLDNLKLMQCIEKLKVIICHSETT